MKKIILLLLPLAFLFSCKNNNGVPDVSGIKIDIKVERFEQDFFKIDTVHLIQSLKNLTNKYGSFTTDYFNNILGLSTDSIYLLEKRYASSISSFIKDYQPLKDSADKLFGDFSSEKKEIIKGLKFVKYYFPRYKLPVRILTFIGPIDGFFQTSFGTEGDVITDDALGIGLHLHMGADFSYYKSAEGQELYPEYISKTFTPAYIPVNCMRNIIDDLYPDKSKGRPLIEQMVEKGKRLYVLDKLLPETPEYLKISYTKKQLRDAYKNEAIVWGFFMSNDLLNNAEQDVNKNYVGEGPKTQELGDESPGNIGSFTGWQIVKKYIVKTPEINLEKLMDADPRMIYEQSKYKPKL